MAGSMSNFLEAEVADDLLSGAGAAYTPPVTGYLGLWTGALDDTSTGATANEVSGGAYARVAVTHNTTNWPAGNPKSNGTAFAFPAATSAWGTVTYGGYLDASTAGNMLFWWDLTASKVIGNGDTAQYPAGSLVFTFN